jgi:hypothetical protein
MKRIPLLALAGLLALPAVALEAQQPDKPAQVHADSGRRAARPGMPGFNRRGMRDGMQRGFAARLLSQRSQLQLTDRQVTQLQEIQQKYQQRNRALMTQMRSSRTDADRQRMQDERKAARERMQAERQAWLKAHPEVQRSLDQLRENRKNEQRDVESVLTAQQKSELQQNMEQRKQRMEQFRRQSGRGAGRDSASTRR